MGVKTSLSFRLCDSTDLEELTRISRTTFVDAFEKDNDPEDFKTYVDKAFDRNEIGKQLEEENTSFYFVYVKNELAGYFKMNINNAQTDLKNQDAVELERIYVLNKFQGLGIGAWILEMAKNLASKTGKTFLWLGVWEENISAIKFYERNGFSKFGMHPYYIGKDRQMDWLLKLDLTNLRTTKNS